jgi:ABC-type transport system involved in multi-copper enzyme maturation permease subunit
MKFGALVYKEIRECMPFAIGIAAILIAIGFTIIQMANLAAEQGKFIFSGGEIEALGVWLLVFSVVLGIILALRQYHTEFSAKTWGFLLHRSVNRGTILLAKLFTGLLCFIPIMIILWSFYIYTYDRPFFQTPPTIRIFWKGLLFIVFGYVSYLAIAMAVLNKAKWYTTKMLSVAFGVWMFLMAAIHWRLLGAWIIIAATAAILLVQIADAFLNREFE